MSNRYHDLMSFFCKLLLIVSQPFHVMTWSTFLPGKERSWQTLEIFSFKQPVMLGKSVGVVWQFNSHTDKIASEEWPQLTKCTEQAKYVK